MTRLRLEAVAFELAPLATSVPVERLEAIARLAPHAERLSGQVVEAELVP